LPREPFLIERWLTSLPAARARLVQGFISTTESAYPGSDPVWLGTTAVKDGSDYGSGKCGRGSLLLPTWTLYERTSALVSLER